MKQVAAIFLIVVFALSQYAKQLSYMECKLTNAFKSSRQQCDCEKKYDVHTLNDKAPSVPQTHFHPVIDELYTAPESKIITSGITFLPEKIMTAFSPSICQGKYSPLYRPPQV